MDLLTPAFGLFFWQCITFLFVLVVLKKFAWKPILQNIRERENYIQSTFEEAEKAEKIIKSVNDKRMEILKSAEVEREKIIGEGLFTKSSLIDDAKKESASLLNSAMRRAEEMIDQERHIAMFQLQQEIKSISTLIAEKLIMDHLSGSQKQEELINKMLSQVQFANSEKASSTR